MKFDISFKVIDYEGLFICVKKISTLKPEYMRLLSLAVEVIDK